MSSTTDITFCVEPTNPSAKLGFEAWLDDKIMFDVDHVQQITKISIPVVDDDAEHVLTLVLKGKRADHTIINSAGEIVSDSLLNILDLSFDGIIMGQLSYDNTVYTHNFNGSRDTIEDRFYGTMGCNGTVILKFTTPIYIWLLEKM